MIEHLRSLMTAATPDLVPLLERVRTTDYTQEMYEQHSRDTAFIRAAVNALPALLACAEWVKEALRGGMHLWYCAVDETGRDACTCGLDELRAALDSLEVGT